MAILFRNLPLLAEGNVPETVTGQQAVAIIACWPLASNAVNIVDRNSSGVLVGDAAFEDASLVLKGGYVDFGTATNLIVGDNISFFLWLKPANEGRIMRVLGKFRIEGNDREYCAFLGPDNRIWVFISDNGSADPAHASLRTTGQSIIRTGEWQSLAIIRDVKQGGDGVRVYVNGESVSTVSAQSPDIHSIQPGNASLTLGAYDIDPGYPEVASNSFIGAISDVSFFGGTLSELDVQEIHDLGRGDGGKWIQTNPSLPVQG
jgi:hypothetical protein